jgi:heptosyltransferase-3
MPVRPARLLVLRGGAIGDFVVTLPVLQALRARWPDAHIELIGYPHVARLALAAGQINHLRSLDEARMARFFSPLMVPTDEDQHYFSSFDVVISYLHDPHHVLHDNLKRCGVAVLLAVSPLIERRHAVDQLLEPLASLAIYDPDPLPRLDLPPDSGPVMVAIHPGSGSARKNWPLDHFVELARRIDEHHPVVFVSADAESELIPSLDLAMNNRQRWHNLPLVELASRLARCRLYIGNDSGITHLAAAVGCPHHRAVRPLLHRLLGATRSPGRRPVRPAIGHGGIDDRCRMAHSIVMVVTLPPSMKDACHGLGSVRA